jgi:hypothetical protein
VTRAKPAAAPGAALAQALLPPPLPLLLQVTSHFAPPLALLLFRAACFLLFISTITAQNVPPNKERPRWLAMFTHVAYIAFAAAMLLGAAITAQVGAGRCQ